MTQESSGVVCVMPRASTAWSGAAAMWVTAAGWAAAARERLGAGWVVTPDRIASPEEVDLFTLASPDRTTSPRSSAAFATVRTAAKDARQLARQRGYARAVGSGPWDDVDLRFVWQHHDLFHRAGESIAARSGVPLVSFVHAPQVWEARKWGVRRPGWADLLERVGERPQLLGSDLVACVSDEVVEAVVELGVDRDRTVVTAMAADPNRFRPDVDGSIVRAHHGLDGCFVVGWVGSFRRFHGLELALEGFAEITHQDPNARLLLVGDGAERRSIEERAASLGLGGAVVFAGSVGHEAMPGYLAAMDAAVVTGRAEGGFHYSPLKLREYLASGRPTIAPALGEVGREFEDGTHVLTYEPGDVQGLAVGLHRLIDDPALRESLSRSARAVALERCTWVAQLDRVLARLDAEEGSEA